MESLEKLPDWLRWVLMIPAAFIAFFGVNIVNRLTFFYAFPNPDSLVFQLALLWVEGTVAVFCFLHVIYKFAPSHKTTTVIISSIIIGVISVAGATLHYANPNTVTPLWKVLLVNGLTLITSIIYAREIATRKIVLEERAHEFKP